MANPEHLAILKQGAEVWNRWRKHSYGIVPDLEDADIIGETFGADLRGIDLHCALLSHANFSRSNLRSADFSRADLSFADLTVADLRRADFRNANMRGVLLRRADLTGAELGGSDFAESTIGSTVFGDVDLSGIKGLELCLHVRPSTIGIDTLLRSNGAIPESFLRGAGIPDGVINYARSLSAKAIEFLSVFISYSTLDQSFADRLYVDLQISGVRCWFAPHNIQGGKKIHEQIDEAIRFYDRLLLILSDASMNSEWVRTEVANARQREIREKRQMLFPISLVPYDRIKEWKAFDADTGKDSAREIREYFIPDFSDWKDHDSYQTAFQRLLKDLRDK